MTLSRKRHRSLDPLKCALLLGLVFPFLNAPAQTAGNEINDHVWKQFVATFNSYDTEGFMAVHSKDAVRSPRDAKAVWNWDAYYEKLKKGDEQGKTSGSKRQLELRFTERLANGDLAVEVGVYKVTITGKERTQAYYGRFHVVLRKENKRWKILVDTDTSEGNTINQKEFLEAQPME